MSYTYSPRNESKNESNNESKQNHVMYNRMPSRATNTMASLTKAREANTKSYSNRFLEQSRLRNDPKYVPPQKPVNISSSEDFPSLGSPKTITPIIPLVSSSGQNYIDMAKGWGKKIEEDEEANRIRIHNAEILRKKIAKENYDNEKKGIPERKTTKKKLMINSRKNEYYDKDEHRFKSLDETISDDSFESGPSHEEDEDYEDDEINDDEINANIGKVRKHDNELY